MLFFPMVGSYSAKQSSIESSIVNLVAHKDSAGWVKFFESLSLCHQEL